MSPRPATVLTSERVIATTVATSKDVAGDLQFRLSTRAPPGARAVTYNETTTAVTPIVAVPRFSHGAECRGVTCYAALRPGDSDIYSAIYHPVRYVAKETIRIILIPAPQS